LHHLRHLLACTAALALFALVGAARPAAGASIGPSCGTCQGSIYSLSTTTLTPISSTATTETWDITYTIDTTGYTGGGTHLSQVALKVSSSITAGSLIAAPGGVADWNVVMGGINAGGCNGSGSGFDCASATSIGVSPVVPGSISTWVFQLTLPTGGLFTGASQASVKARYVDDGGNKVGALVSEDITLSVVPEPSALVLVGAAAALSLGRARQRFSA
jgi:hypothetical protein